MVGGSLGVHRLVSELELLQHVVSMLQVGWPVVQAVGWLVQQLLAIAQAVGCCCSLS